MRLPLPGVLLSLLWTQNQVFSLECLLQCIKRLLGKRKYGFMSVLLFSHESNVAGLMSERYFEFCLMKVFPTPVYNFWISAQTPLLSTTVCWLFISFNLSYKESCNWMLPYSSQTDLVQDSGICLGFKVGGSKPCKSSDFLIMFSFNSWIYSLFQAHYGLRSYDFI